MAKLAKLGVTELQNGQVIVNFGGSGRGFELVTQRSREGWEGFQLARALLLQDLLEALLDHDLALLCWDLRVNVGKMFQKDGNTHCPQAAM